MTLPRVGGSKHISVLVGSRSIKMSVYFVIRAQVILFELQRCHLHDGAPWSRCKPPLYRVEQRGHGDREECLSSQLFQESLPVGSKLLLSLLVTAPTSDTEHQRYLIDRLGVSVGTITPIRR